VKRRRLTLISAFLLSVSALAGDENPARALAELPGFDFSKLPPASQKELASVFQDEFDYCGRPVTLYASLRKGACKHTKRMAGLAAGFASEGEPAGEIINTLAKYNLSFNNSRKSFKVDERTCRGPKDAKVTLVEFSDFECPYCGAARPMLEELQKARPQVRLCWMPFPLTAHPNAIPAGQAALFARDAGKFWPMHDALFINQLSLSEVFIKDLATKQGLDGNALAKVMASTKYKDELEASKEAGKNAGVDSTPTVFINGRKLTLGISAEALIASVDDELEWSGSWPSN
jgi:protein-disulfide isomerase